METEAIPFKIAKSAVGAEEEEQSTTYFQELFGEDCFRGELRKDGEELWCGGVDLMMEEEASPRVVDGGEGRGGG